MKVRGQTIKSIFLTVLFVRLGDDWSKIKRLAKISLVLISNMVGVILIHLGFTRSLFVKFEKWLAWHMQFSMLCCHHPSKIKEIEK